MRNAFVLEPTMWHASLRRTWTNSLEISSGFTLRGICDKELVLKCHVNNKHKTTPELGFHFSCKMHHVDGRTSSRAARRICCLADLQLCRRPHPLLLQHDLNLRPVLVDCHMMVSDRHCEYVQNTAVLPRIPLDHCLHTLNSVVMPPCAATN